MNSPCTYKGFITHLPMGLRMDCPVCGNKITVMDRDGQPWIATHSREKVISKAYQHCTKGKE